LRYFPLSFFLQTKFHRRVRKVSVDAGVDCPNRDGTLGDAGCVFCNIASYSPSRRRDISTVTGQIDAGLQRIRGRFGVDRVVAYFQPGTNTYGPVDRLRCLWEEAASHPNVVGLVVGTRPDCVQDAALDLLAELTERTWVSIEYGLQTIHDRSLDWLNRRHHYDAFLDAVARSRPRGLDVGAHVILGLPGETGEDMLATARELARLQVNSVKLHNLYVTRNTALAEMFSTGQVVLPGLDEYVDFVVGFLEELHPGCVIDRLSGDAPPEYLVAPAWCSDRARVRRAIETELERRQTWQGRRCSV
jgi:radical SAM protein (TIGR01212 family)